MQNGTQVQAVPDDYTLRIRQAAEIVGKSTKTLFVWRRKGVGPACVVRGSRVYYSRAACERLAERLRQSPYMPRGRYTQGESGK